MDQKAIIDFFHELSPHILRLVKEGSKEKTIFKDKGTAVGSYATQVDIDTENYIVSSIQKHFPGDVMLAEEGYSDTKIPDGRIWIIDPICGTSNLGKGILDFCTNIALADKGEVIAACVIDHSQGQYIWSIGDGKVYIDTSLYTSPPIDAGQIIEIDLGSIRGADQKFREKYSNFLHQLIEETTFELISLHSSLGFAYTAVGKTDGFIEAFGYPWDIAAASFLVQQAGGIVTGIDGSRWTLSTVGTLGARNSEIHKELLRLLKDS